MSEKIKEVKLSEFVENPDNPQTATDDAFKDLVESVRKDPETLEANKIAYCTDYVSPISGVSYVGQRVVMAGNKRLRALKTIHGPDGEVNAAYFFDLTPLGVEARRRWLVRSNVQTGEWEADLLMKLYSKDELKDLMGADDLSKLLTAQTDEQQPEKVAEKKQTKNFIRAFYLVSFPIGDTSKYIDVIKTLKEKGAEVDEQLG